MDVQRINLIGLTSSRRQLRTNAYTVLILFVDGNDFSNCVRSVNLMRMLVCGDGEMSMRNEMGLMHLRPSGRALPLSPRRGRHATAAER